VASRDAEGRSLGPWSDDNLRMWLDPLWTPGRDTASYDTNQESDSEPVKQLKTFIAKHGNFKVVTEACEAMGCTAELHRVIDEHFGSKR
jgi:hypothetical protein